MQIYIFGDREAETERHGETENMSFRNCMGTAKL